jgi:hypothetical protein
MTRRCAVRTGLVLALILTDVCLIFVWRLAWFFDAASWYGIDLTHLYEQARLGLLGVGAFRFSPAVAVLLLPVSYLPWAVFAWSWLGISLATAAWLGGRRWWWLALTFPFTVLELQAGNIHLLIAAAVVIGLRWPGAWAFVLLTKVTPGIGLLWFAFRREWRALGVALGTTAVVVAIGVAIAPGLWHAWVEMLFLSAPPGGSPGGPTQARQGPARRCRHTGGNQRSRAFHRRLGMSLETCVDLTWPRAQPRQAVAVIVRLPTTLR